ncbi:unnamed protein product [Paramecium sonneborni]|uniref:Uncharacterized protein n=1 Tax=Paramecium sonneborni TaxID=65129 RepID=A0A8S1PSP3_9CILI|nr:unnamed protein product [Paramecium sonneborni]
MKHLLKYQQNTVQVDLIREHFNNQKMLSQINIQIRLMQQVNLIQQDLKSKCWSIYQPLYNMGLQQSQWFSIQFYKIKFHYGNNTLVHIK